MGSPFNVPDDDTEEDESLPPLLGGFDDDYVYQGPILVDAPQQTGPFVPPSRTAQGIQTVRVPNPNYREGFQTTLYGMTESQIAGLQDDLESVGLITGSYSRGDRFDSKTMRGFTQLLGMSNAVGLDANQTIAYLQSQGFDASGGGGGGGGRAAPTIQLTNSDDLREVFRSAVFQTTGTYNTNINIDGMVDAYHALERQYQTRAQSGGGGEVERAPNVQTFAAQQIREQDPTAVEAKTVADLGDSFFSILGPAV